jgi:general secretion pathway protein G
MNRTLTRRRTLARRGFTLVEVIVVVTVLALLMTVVGGRMLGLLGQGQAEIAKTQAGKISGALTLYLLDVGQPQPEDGFDLSVLTLRPNEGGGPNGPYLSKVTDVLDPWKEPFLVVVPGEVNADYDIFSYGADKAPGGEGPDADLTH